MIYLIIGFSQYVFNFIVVVYLDDEVVSEGVDYEDDDDVIFDLKSLGSFKVGWVFW